ncbi:MAG: DUF167 domain-containing protein [Nanoarchaeota archaeon]
MLIEVKVKIGKENKIISIENNTYTVMIKAKPVDGEANKELLKFLKKQLGKELIIKRGYTSRNKILEIIS